MTTSKSGSKRERERERERKVFLRSSFSHGPFNPALLVKCRKWTRFSPTNSLSINLSCQNILRNFFPVFIFLFSPVRDIKRWKTNRDGNKNIFFLIAYLVYISRSIREKKYPESASTTNTKKAFSFSSIFPSDFQLPGAEKSMTNVCVVFERNCSFAAFSSVIRLFEKKSPFWASAMRS